MLLYHNISHFHAHFNHYVTLYLNLFLLHILLIAIYLQRSGTISKTNSSRLIPVSDSFHLPFAKTPSHFNIQIENQCFRIEIHMAFRKSAPCIRFKLRSLCNDINIHVTRRRPCVDQFRIDRAAVVVCVRFIFGTFYATRLNRSFVPR